MLRADEILKRLKPLRGKQADAIWNSFLVSDDEERKLIQQALEILHSQNVDDYEAEKIILTPPSKFEQLYGEYPLGMVWYADKPLYPFALLERELVQHIGIFGRTGAGKSYLVRSLLITHLLHNKPLLLFDWKGTYTDFAGSGDVLLFIPGSTTFPFFFNPLDLQGIPPEQQKSYLRQVIDIFIDTYLEDLKLLTVQGVEYLLLLAVDRLIEQNNSVTFHSLYELLNSFEGRMREMDWKTSAIDILYKLTTGPLGKVMTGQSWSMEWLVKQQAIFELNNCGSAKDKSFFIRTLLLRLYYYFQEKGSSDYLKLLLVIEEAHNILLKKSSGYETIIELVLRQIREFGVGICIVDQHPSLMSLPALGTYCTVSFNLRLKQDRDAMASALLLEKEKKTFLGKLPPRFAIVKIQDRFLQPFLIQTFFVQKAKKPSVLELKNRMKKLLPALQDVKAEKDQQSCEKEKEAQIGGSPVFSEVFHVLQRKSKVVQACRKIAKKRKKPLLWEEILLIHIYRHPLMATMERYNALGLDKHQGHRYRNSLLEKEFIAIESISTSSGRVKLMVPTEKGFQWLSERGFYCKVSDKEGGILHQYWKRRLAEKFRKEGFKAEEEVPIDGKKAVDLVVSGNGKRIAVEVETGKNSYQQIIANIEKCSALDGVTSFILDAGKAEKVKALISNNRAVIVSIENQCLESAIGFLSGKGGNRGDTT